MRRRSVSLSPDGGPAVSLSVLKFLDKATQFLRELNHMLVGLGVLSVLAGSALVFLISHTFTRPLANLVAGVRALEGGDFGYPLESSGGDEVAEVTGAFDRMRGSLLCRRISMGQIYRCWRISAETGALQ